MLGNTALLRLVAVAEGRGASPIQRQLPWSKAKREERQKKREERHKKRIEKLKKKQAHGLTPEDEPGGSLVEDIGGAAGASLEMGAGLVDPTGTALTQYGAPAAMEEVEGGEVAFTGETQGAEMTSAGIGLWGLATGITTMAGGAAAGIAAFKLVKTLREREPDWGWEATNNILDLMIGSNALVLGAGAAAGYTASSVAKGVAMTGSEAAGEAGTLSLGFADALTGIGGIVTGFLGLAKGLTGTFQYLKSIKAKGWRQGGVIGDIGTEALNSLKGFLSAGRSLIWAAQSFVEMAEVGAEFVQTIPVLGAAVNIAIQLIEGLVTTIDVIRQVYRLIKGVINVNRMQAITERAGRDAKAFIGGAIDVNRKRWRRTIVPLIADGISLLANVVSIGGSLLNIIGSFTTAAYGAGVAVMAAGYAAGAGAAAAKVGAAALKGGQTATRWTKQKIRDLGKGGTTGPEGQGNRMYRFGKTLGIDMDKTTQKKNENLAKQISSLLVYIKNLKDPLPPENMPMARQFALQEYEDAYTMVKATGVNVKELMNASNGQEVVNLLAAAMRRRE